MGISQLQMEQGMRHYGTSRDPFAGQEDKVARYTEHLEDARGIGFAASSHLKVVPVAEADPCAGCPFEDVLLQPGRLLHYMKARNGGQIPAIIRH